MTGFTRVLGALALLFSIFAMTMTPGRAADAPERFSGEASIGGQPGFPMHIELRRSGDAVTGTVTIPFGAIEIVDGKGDSTIVGSFAGAGGSGAMTLRIDGDALTGEFDLQGQPGTIAAQRTTVDAKTFFRPAEQKLDLTAEQWLADLDRLVEVLTGDHGSPFHRISQEKFEAEADRVRAAIPDLGGVEVALEFRRLGALIGDGHTLVDLPKGRPGLPLEFYLFDDGLHVVGAPAARKDLLGAKLGGIGGMSASDIVEALRAYVPQGETQGFHGASAAELVALPDMLSAIGAGEGPEFAFAFEVDGTQKQVDVTAEAQAETALLGGGAPLWLRNGDSGFWSEWLDDGSLYVNWRSYDGLPEHTEALLKTVDARHPRRLIVDLRDNDGGDFTAGRAFIEAIRSRPWLNRSGVLYVLIGRETFSAAMTNAVDFKLTTEATLVGEPAGAAPNNWQEVRRVTLPSSGLRVGVSTQYYEFLPGQPELAPDHPVLPALEDWGSAQDAALRFVLAQPVD